MHAIHVPIVNVYLLGGERWDWIIGTNAVPVGVCERSKAGGKLQKKVRYLYVFGKNVTISAIKRALGYPRTSFINGFSCLEERRGGLDNRRKRSAGGYLRGVRRY